METVYVPQRLFDDLKANPSYSYLCDNGYVAPIEMIPQGSREGLYIVEGLHDITGTFETRFERDSDLDALRNKIAEEEAYCLKASRLQQPYYYQQHNKRRRHR